MVGMTDRGGDRVSTYSLGMRQRLGIAAALLSDPKLLLVDEPANGLDPAGIVALRNSLRSLAAQGKTVFISSHILEEVRQLADMVGIVAGGRLVREGRIAELLASEGVVRVRVGIDQVPVAIAALEQLAPGGVETGGEATRIVVQLPPERAADVNRTLAQAGIYASGIEGGSDLEALFLQLTGASGAGDGSFGTVGAIPAAELERRGGLRGRIGGRR
jgi:ABC-2 type transport system ATP-binding protein